MKIRNKDSKGHQYGQQGLRTYERIRDGVQGD